MPEGQQEQGGGDWLPPEPAGTSPAPGSPPQPAPAPAQQQPSPGTPAPAQPHQPQPSAGTGGSAPQGWPPPHPGWGQPPGWYGPPPGYWAPPPDTGPGNGHAVAALVLALTAVSLLALSFGFLFVLALPCAIVAIFLGRKGVKKVDAGETAKHRSLAQAGFVIGIVGTVLSLLAAAGWIAVFLIDGFLDDFNPGPPGGGDQVLALGSGVARAALALIG